MQGDTLVIEDHHHRAAISVAARLLPEIQIFDGKYTMAVAGESGAGKSEIAVAISRHLEVAGIPCVILQQDDYFRLPPKSNDLTRRKDISWAGPQEVRLDLMSAHLEAFIDNESAVQKPLVIYEEDRIDSETLEMRDARVAIAEGTYTSKLDHVETRVFIDRDYRDTRKHRERRNRHASELDDFIDRVLVIEHEIISADKVHADIVINRDYTINS
ncbi:MAG: zeta toxin family protein [Gammaproteobacteria bacterium]|nr:zeta toxin family protein [Gammaproteobacteria bacterium]